MLMVISFSLLNFNASAQKKLFHENGRVVYDSAYKVVYYSTGTRAFNPVYNTVYYENNKIAYASDYKNIYYSNGSIAYNNSNKNVFYSDGSKAYDARTRLVYYKNGSEAVNLYKGEQSNYTIEDESLKITVDKFNQFKFELALVDVGFVYYTDFYTYFKVTKGTIDKNSIIQTVSLQ